MAIQPNNCSQDTSFDYSIDYDRILFFSDDFHGARDNLNLSADNGPLNTPELIKPNLLIPSITEVCTDPKKDVCFTDVQEHYPTVPDQDLTYSIPVTDEECKLLMLDNGNKTDNGSNQQMDTDVQTIAQIANDLYNSMFGISIIMVFQTIMAAIKRHPHPILSILTQPVSHHRFRYRSDGIRYLEKSRKSPMSIKLPILDGCLTQPGQSFYIQLTIVTTRNNPQRKVYLHQHEIIYNAKDAEQNGLASCRIPVTADEIRQRRKLFRRLSVIKTRLNEYQFDLVPFDPLITDDHIYHYTAPNEDKLTKKQKAKEFDRVYHTDKYQIVCQLMIKHNDDWYTTDLHCETHIVTDN